LLKYGVANNRLHLGAGPQIGWLTSATDTYQGTGAYGNQVQVEEDIKDGLAGTDAGLLFNVEWKVKEGAFSPSLVVRYYLGLTDTVKDNPGDAVYNRVFSILTTIALGGKSAVADD